MPEDTSLTDAVKRAAGISLTEAMKDVAGRRAWFVEEVLATHTGKSEGAVARLTCALRAACARVAAMGVVAVTFLCATSTPTMLDTLNGLLASAHRRVALVVGNSAYRHAPRLENPKNDAGDISAVLRKLEFHVIEAADLDKRAFEAILDEFASALKGADVGFFFYAGHGIQVSGHNYLIPIDAELTTLATPDVEMVRLERVHRTMEREALTNLLFFDACRDNPLTRSPARALGLRSAQIGRGLAAVESGAGTLISFSTQPGNVALDGAGRNSPFSAALIRELGTSSEDVNAILIAVRNEVMRQTDGKQVPWEHSALTRRLYLNPAARSARLSDRGESWAASRPWARARRVATG